MRLPILPAVRQIRHRRINEEVQIYKIRPLQKNELRYSVGEVKNGIALYFFSTNLKVVPRPGSLLFTNNSPL